MSETTIPQTFSRQPLVWLATWFALGIVVGHLSSLIWFVALIASLVLAIICIVRLSAGSFLLPILFVSLGALCGGVETASVSQDRLKRIYEDGRIQSREPVDIEGVSVGLPEPAYDGFFVTLRSEKLTFKNTEIAATGNVRLFFPLDQDPGANDTDRLGIGYGSRVRVFCRLEREERFLNPGVASRLEILDRQGIDATATVKSVLLMEKLGYESYFIPLRWVYERRQRLIYAFRDHFSAPTAGVMIASLLGDEHFLDRETSEVFRDGGTFHVLVISGLHITFIGGLTLWIVGYCIRGRFLRFILAAGFLWSYTIAVGAEVPVVRACIMFTVLLFSRVVYREGSQLNAFGLCCLLLLVWRPTDLFSASFQLTLVSVAAIVGCSFPLIEKLRAIGSWIPTADRPLPPRASKRVRRFCEILYWNDAAWKVENKRQIWSANLFKSHCPVWLSGTSLQSLAGYAFEGLTVSVIVQIWMLPLLVIYFHRVSPASIVLNLWVGSFLGVESFCAVFAVLIAGVSEWLAAPLVGLTELMNGLMMSIPAWFSDNRLASFRLPTYHGGLKAICFIYGIGVITSAALIFKWRPFAMRGVSTAIRRSILLSLFVTSAIGLTIVFHPFSTPGPDGYLSVDFLDVGQGDSALVTFPNGTTMLVDGGGQPGFRDDAKEFEPDTRRIGESVVSEFLWEKGYSHIDYLLATHADADHIQGLVDVARNFDVGVVLVGDVPSDDPDFSALMRVVESRKIALSTVHRGDNLTLGGANLQILNPPTGSLAGTSTNNSSIVMRITFGDITFLLTGDIERPAETELLADASCDLRAHVIKVPHHGSRTSSTDDFVSRVDAETAIISVGRHSRFGHPHKEVVDRWRDHGAEVVRTGENGTITVRTDGRYFQVQTFIPR